MVHIAEQAPCVEGEDCLSPRERQVARYLILGMKNREIGLALGISKRTVDIHVRNILAKTGALSRRQVGRYLRRFGIV